MCLTSPFGQLREDDRQFAMLDCRPCTLDVKRSVHAHDARESTEFTLDEVVALFMAALYGRFLPGDDDDTCPVEHTNRLGRNATDVDDDFQGVTGFANIERWVALARICPLLVLEVGGQVVEQCADVLGQLAGFARWQEGKLRHSR